MLFGAQVSRSLYRTWRVHPPTLDAPAPGAVESASDGAVANAPPRSRRSFPPSLLHRSPNGKPESAAPASAPEFPDWGRFPKPPEPPVRMARRGLTRARNSGLVDEFEPWWATFRTWTLQGFSGSQQFLLDFRADVARQKQARPVVGEAENQRVIIGRKPGRAPRPRGPQARTMAPPRSSSSPAAHTRSVTPFCRALSNKAE